MWISYGNIVVINKGICGHHAREYVDIIQGNMWILYKGICDYHAKEYVVSISLVKVGVFVVQSICARNAPE